MADQWKKIPKNIFDGRADFGAIFGGSQPSFQSARGILGCGRLRVECKTPRFCPDFTSICPVHAPYCPAFASQNPRFASYAMERG